MPSDRNLNHRYSLSFRKVKTLHVESPSFNMHGWENHGTCTTSKQLESALRILDSPNANEMQKRMECIHGEIANERSLNC